MGNASAFVRIGDLAKWARLMGGLWLACAVLAAGEPAEPPAPAVPTLPAVDEVPVRPLVYTPAPLGNPLAGFFPFKTEHDLSRTFPHSMEWFYVSLKDLMNGMDSFTFDKGLEPILAEIAGRGHFAVGRVYLDYPGKKTASGIPDFLIKAGLKVSPYKAHGGGSSPDYTDERLIVALEKFIAEFGRRYDGDVRLGFMTLGLLGFWGEWHTYPHEDWFPKEETQNRILRAYAKAFKRTRLLMRYPMADGPKYDFGYHDDSFAYSTLPTKDWHFMSLVQNARQEEAWKEKPIGGEVRPEAQEFVWTGKCSDGNPLEDFATCVKQTHASWLIYDKLWEKKLDPEARARAEAACRLLGYELHIAGMRVGEIPQKRTFKAGVVIENRGVAPFYYNWSVELQVRTRNGQKLQEWVTGWKLSTVLPGKPEEFTFTQDQHGLPVETHHLFLRVVNPLPKSKPLLFANKEQGPDGWLKLGELRVIPGTGAKKP